MNIFENFNKAKQKFGENLTRQAIEAKIPNQFVYAACKFNAENGAPFNDLYLLFSQWTTYVVSKNANINVDALDYNTFWSTIQDYKKQYGEEGKVYDDGTVSITHISSLEQMKKLPIKNLWCIRREKHWNEYQEKGARFYLITNNNYSDESNCRYVMVEMYANGEIGYWSTDNELIDAEGSTKRLPPLAEYQKTLGGALQKIKELQRKITESKQYRNMNKKLIRLTESDLHRIVKESVNKILNEYVSGLDPRTLANYAKGREAQGQHDKAQQGMQTARDTWNANYSDGDRMTDSFGDNYGIIKNDWNGKSRLQNVYRPNIDVTDRGITNYDNNYSNPKSEEQWRVNGYVGNNKMGANVAKQMAQGNGNFVNGKWQ